MKIALLGSAPSSIPFAPFKDSRFDTWLGGKPPSQYPPSPFIADEWQLWGCSPGCFGVAPRTDRWFEVHRWEPGAAWFSPEYVQFLKEYRGAVYTGGVIPEIPNHVPYPIQRVEAEFSSYFLHSSLSLMMAIAIMEIDKVRAERRSYAEMVKAKPFEEWAMWPFQNKREELELTDADDVIGMWGVDMAAHEEYGDQKDGCIFFMLEALRRGIAVYVPPESCVLRPKPIYGLAEWNHDYIKATARMRELNNRLSDANAKVAEATKTANVMMGAADDLQYMINTWLSPYGIPAGVVVRHEHGSGLGGGTTLPRPQGNAVQWMPHPAPAPSPADATIVTEQRTSSPSDLVLAKKRKRRK